MNEYMKENKYWMIFLINKRVKLYLNGWMNNVYVDEQMD